MIRVKSFIIVPTGKIWEPVSAKANVSLAFSNMQLKLPDCRILLAGFDEMENLQIMCFNWTSHSKNGASWLFLAVVACHCYDLLLFFAFVLNTNEYLRWLWQKLGCSRGWDERLFASEEKPVWTPAPSYIVVVPVVCYPDASLFLSKQGTWRKGTHAPAAQCCHVNAFHPSSFSLEI